jgi:hypothetical protein
MDVHNTVFRYKQLRGVMATEHVEACLIHVDTNH